MTSKKYFLQEMKLTDEQLERVWNFFQENVKVIEADTLTHTRVFQIEYRFSTIGVSRIAKCGDKTLWIDREECNP